MTEQILKVDFNEDLDSLHRTPFILLWFASYGLAWFLLLLWYDVIRYTDSHSLFATITVWYITSPAWMNGIVTGLIFGVSLSTVQDWLLQQRYGQSPKYWQLATIVGSLIAAMIFPMISRTYNWSSNTIWLSVAMWFFVPSLFQAFVLHKLSPFGWMMAWVGLIAGMLAMDITIFQLGPSNGLDNACILATIIQVTGSCAVILRVMPRPLGTKEHPTKEKKKKDLVYLRKQFHPIVFVSFWILSYFIAWLIIYLAPLGAKHFGIEREILAYLENIQAEWILSLLAGLSFALVASVMQKWLIYKQSKQQVPLWISVNLVTYGLVGIFVFDFFAYDQVMSQEAKIALIIWFTVPNLIQTFLLRRKIHGAWIWSLTGIVSGIIAILISSELGWRQANALSGAIFGGLALSIISASTFLFLLSQQNRHQISTPQAATVE